MPDAINHNTDKYHTTDYGLFQINSGWINFFSHRGLDVVHDPIDNLEAGFYLLKTRGTKDWKASSYCWNNPVDAGVVDYAFLAHR